MAGKMPYRDFYYYLPPLNLLIDYVFWKFSFGFLIIFRVWYLIERTSIYIFVYKILNMRYDWIRSSIACSISAILCTCDVFDLFGDYNQHIVVLTVALVYFAIRFSQTNSESKKYQMLAIAGGIMGLMFLTKQTIFVSANIIYFIIFTVLCIKEKNRNYFKYILFIAVGEIIPIAIAFWYFIVNNSLINFIDQVFVSVDGKGTIFDIVLPRLLAKDLITSDELALLGEGGLCLNCPVFKSSFKLFIIPIISETFTFCKMFLSQLFPLLFLR